MRKGEEVRLNEWSERRGVWASALNMAVDLIGSTPHTSLAVSGRAIFSATNSKCFSALLSYLTVSSYFISQIRSSKVSENA